MPRYKNHFSLDEARARLPDLRKRFAEISELVARIRGEQSQQEKDRLRVLRGNGHGPVLVGAEISPHLAAIQEHIDTIVASGVQIKDLERGLIDFPHYLDGDQAHEVFLCFEMSEDDIRYWHEIDDGFNGRQPL